MFTNRTSCALCASGKLEEKFSLAPTPIANRLPVTFQQAQTECGTRIPLTILVCGACQHVQLKELVEPHILFDNYPYVSVSNMTMKYRLDRLSDTIEINSLKSKEDTILEIGSNDGYLLSRFKSKGYKVLGVDPAAVVADIAMSRGVETLIEYFSSSTVQKIFAKIGKPKVIIANNVLAHSSNLLEILKGIAKLLDDDATLYMEVSYLVDVLRKCLIDTMYHEHTSYHHLGPLRKALREFSLEIVEAEILETHGGSIRLRIKKNVRKSCISRSVEEIMEHETKSINLNSQSWLDLSSKVTKLRSMILDQSLKTQKDGKYNIYGYGVSAKLVSLYFGLSLDLLGIEQFFDDNQMKVNRYVPGTLNVVKSSTELPVTDKTILLFAWNYMAEIVEALKSKGHQATILCPLPYFKTINI